MSSSLNKVSLIGYVGRDPELRSTQSGNRVASLSLATSESWKDKSSGERREHTEWHRIVVFNEGLVGVVESYVKKGTRLYLEGAIKTRKLVSKEGEERLVTEIVLQNFQGKIKLLGGSNGTRAGTQPRTQPATAGAAQDYYDEVPF